jgi:pimeloyl-ACP methyl ester carboxylesterase
MHPTAAEPPLATLDFAGYRCRYRVSGNRASGRLPVFFVSGAFQAMASWRKFADHFEPLTTVLLADLPGMGQADVLPRGHGLDFLAGAADAVLEAAGIERAFVVSASYGSPIAWRLAQRFPRRVARVILSGVMKEIPAPVWEPTRRTLDTLTAGRMAEFARDIVGGLLCHDPCRPIERRRAGERLLLAQLENMTPADRIRYVENTARLLEHPPLDLSQPPAAPALVFTGEHDVYTRPEYCREIAMALPDSWFTLIERADHLFHIQRFDVTLALVDGFWSDRDLAAIAGTTGHERFGGARCRDAVA